jgi:two-component system, chemotaxis family, protein-glutamate methylesterase/glutaminase
MADATIDAIVIGGSAGAIEILSMILPALPRGFAPSVFVTVHIPTSRPSLLATLFADKCALEVQEAEDKTPIEPGVIYFAPPDYHLLVESKELLTLSVDEAVNYSRPAIDVLFESAADVYEERLIGVVLTGANQDGAEGLRRIVTCGGAGVVQLPETAYATEMPRAALRACPQAETLTPEAIADYLLHAAGC